MLFMSSILCLGSEPSPESSTFVSDYCFQEKEEERERERKGGVRQKARIVKKREKRSRGGRERMT